MGASWEHTDMGFQTKSTYTQKRWCGRGYTHRDSTGATVCHTRQKLQTPFRVQRPLQDAAQLPEQMRS